MKHHRVWLEFASVFTFLWTNDITVKFLKWSTCLIIGRMIWLNAVGTTEGPEMVFALEKWYQHLKDYLTNPSLTLILGKNWIWPLKLICCWIRKRQSLAIMYQHEPFTIWNRSISSLGPAGCQSLKSRVKMSIRIYHQHWTRSLAFKGLLINCIKGLSINDLMIC